MQLFVAVFRLSGSWWLSVGDTENAAEQGLRRKWEVDGFKLINPVVGPQRALELFKEMTWDRAKSLYEFSIRKVVRGKGFEL